MKLLTRIFDRFLEVLTFGAGTIVVLMMLAVTVEVVTRYFLHNPLTGVIDVTQVMIIWIVFLAAAWLLKKDGHVRMDLVTSRLKPRAQVILSIVTCTISALICLVISWYGAQVTLIAFQEGTHEIALINIPTGWVQIVIPLGSTALFIQFLRRAYGYWVELREPTTGEVGAKMRAIKKTEE